MHRYVVVRIATSSLRMWSPGFQFLGFPLFSHSIPYNGLSVSIFRSLYCFKEEYNSGKFFLYWDFFSPFLVSPTVSPCSIVGTQADRWCQFTLLQIMLLIFSLIFFEMILSQTLGLPKYVSGPFKSLCPSRKMVFLSPLAL